MKLTQVQLLSLRCMIQKLGWKEFLYEIASLAAEQADKVPRDGPQDKALSSFSMLIHNGRLDPLLSDMGFFDYLGNSLVPDDWRSELEKNRP